MASSDPPLHLPALILIGGDGCYSGVPTHIAQTMRALQGQACITVLSDKNRGGYDFVAVEDHGNDARHEELPGLRTTPRPWIWLRAARQLSARLRAAPDAVVWAHARMAVLLVRMLLATGALPSGQRVVVTYHGLPFDPGHRRGMARLSRLIERTALRFSPPHDLVFLSKTAQGRFQAAIGPDICARHRLSVLGNCSDLGKVPPPALPDSTSAHEVRTLVMTGRTGYQKNVEAAARLFAHLPDNYRLILCGAGTDKPGTRALFAKLLKPDALKRVTFRGPVADVRPILAEACGYLMTSRYEGMPIGALEAFEAGLPVALSEITGTVDILAAHPEALPLHLEDPRTEARALDAMITRYLQSRTQIRAAIHAAWADRFSYPQWKCGMQQLWDRVRTPLS
ncbi:glycosyltransferase family 4 protein [Roseovarius sp. S4756]|uniref:glycosyltransferase family 4 protein n=1 Tax=Roseovarius maritimus TaxID=3342637 RepID=UPI003727C01C